MTFGLLATAFSNPNVRDYPGRRVGAGRSARNLARRLPLLSLRVSVRAGGREG